MPATLEQPVVRSFNELARAFAGDYSFLEQRKDNPSPEQKRAWEPYVSGHITRNWNTYGGGATGGYLLSYEMASDVWDKARSNDGPLGKCLIFPTKAHGFKVPSFEETSRANGSRWGGIQAYWQGQDDDNALGSATLTKNVMATKPTLNMVDFRLQRCLVFTEPMSRDLIADTALVERMLTYAAHHEIRYALQDKMFNGNGTWCPLGVINAPCTVALGRTSAGTISYQDIDKMWSQMWPYCRRNSYWHCNDDTLNKIDQVATAFNWPYTAYLPEGKDANEWPLMKGRPILVHEQLPALGNLGDLVLVDWSQYGLAVSANDQGVPSIEAGYGRPEIAVEGMMSEHLKFDTDSAVWRFKIRVDGKPMWRSWLTIADGAQTASAFVTIAK